LEELQQLFENMLQNIKNVIEIYGDLEVDEKNDILSYECSLITLLLFCIGGQRREYIVGIHLKVMNIYLIVII